MRPLAAALLLAPALAAAAAPAISVQPDPITFGPLAVGKQATIPVAVLNAGDANLTVASIAISGTDSGDFAVDGAPPLPTTLATNVGFGFAVTFAPKSPGLRTATLTIASDDPNTPVKTIMLSGDGFVPSLVVAPEQLTFPPAAPPKQVVVTNQSGMPQTIFGATFAGPDAADFALVAPPQFPLQLAPNAQLPLTVAFVPVGPGLQIAMLTIQNGANVPLAVALAGQGAAGGFTVQPAFVDFKTVAVGATAKTQVVIGNDGAGALHLFDLSIDPPAGSAFSSQVVAELHQNGTFPVTVAANGSFVVDVEFAPSALGPTAANLLVETDDPMHAHVQVPLAGAGGVPGLALAPSTLDFGGVPIGAPAKLPLTVRNDGAITLHVTSIAVAGADLHAFAVAAPTPFDLPPSGQVAVEVTFAPDARRDFAAVVVASADFAAPAATQLRGRGQQPALTVTPAGFDFGAVAPGDRSAPREFVIRNGEVPLTLARIGAGDPAFVVDTTGTALALAPFAETRFTVAFAPADAGPFVSTIAVAPASAAPVQVPVAGAGGDPRDRLIFVDGWSCALGRRAAGAPLAALLAVALALLARRRRIG